MRYFPFIVDRTRPWLVLLQASTTTITYVVAHPHPEVPPEKRVRPFRADSAFYGTTLLERLGDAYLNHRGDLEDGTLWKASRPTVAKLPP